MMITKEQLLVLFPKAKKVDALVEAINKNAPKYGLTTRKSLAMFIAQCGHECGGFTTFSENLNYSAKGLRNTWAKRFPTDAIANQYARKPRDIANKVYADRMGNGNEASGDGWKYAGKGAIQLTGKDNYTRFSKETGIDVLKNPDILTQYPEAIISAMWFWNSGNRTGKSLNVYAEADDIEGSTKIINGGELGIKERTEHYHELLKVVK